MSEEKMSVSQDHEPAITAVKSGWRPISSAPRTIEQDILASATGAVWFQATWDDDDECWRTFNCYLETDQGRRGQPVGFEPKFWIPLPAQLYSEAPPVDDQSAAEGCDAARLASGGPKS